MLPTDFMLNSWEMFTEDVMKTGTEVSCFIVEEMSKVVNLVARCYTGLYRAQMSM